VSDFLKFFNEVAQPYGLLLSVDCNNINEWNVLIQKRIYEKDKDNIGICNIRSYDMELCFAQAQVELKNWLTENMGGYELRIEKEWTNPLMYEPR
jgi:hypothetical protein